MKSSSTGIIWFASINKSNLVLCPPVRKKIGISFTMPVTWTLLPGFVLFSVSGETKSFRRRTFILFGCAPPSICSGTSSRTIICASHSSLLRRLNFPFLPQLHLVGSWILVSTCIMLNMFPHEGHSYLASAICGLTSDLFRTTPSNESNFPRFLLLMLRMSICELAGSLSNRRTSFCTPGFMCSTAISPALSMSSGFSRSRSARSGSNIARIGKSIARLLSPFRIRSSSCS